MEINFFLSPPELNDPLIVGGFFGTVFFIGLIICVL
jgi:hypothetical protein